LLEAIKSVLKQAAHASHSGQAAEAERLYKEAAAEAKAKDDLTRAEALLGVAQSRRDAGDLVLASINYSEAITLLRGIGATSQLAHALRNAADVRSELREYAVAGAHIEESIRIYRALVASGEAEPLDLAGALRVSALNDEREAQVSWREACEIYTSLHDDRATRECEVHLKCLEHETESNAHKEEQAA
jgi:tetratricopeptide (TPR) repeat protein